MKALSSDALILLQTICPQGYHVTHTTSSAAMNELLEHKYIVPVSEEVFVITRQGRLVGSGHDVPVFDR